MRHHMHTIIAGAALAAAASLLPAGTATASGSVVSGPAAAYNRCGYHPTTTVHLRSGAGTRYASLGLLETTDTLYADRTSGGWYRVSLSGDSANGLRSGRTGWVARQHLTAYTCMRLD